MASKKTPTNGPPPAKRGGCGGLFFLMMLVAAAGIGTGIGLFIFVLEDAKATIAMLDDFRPKVGTRVYSADGEQLGEFTTEARQLVPLNEMPLHLLKAFMATEDNSFYEHRGVRPDAIVNAALYMVRTGRIRGGSTITQQLVRNVDVTGVSFERTIQRKIEEAIIALQLEREYTKDEILELYLNQIFLGISAHGVEAAAQQYFGKSCRDLTIAQSALLAGLARAPNNNQPFRYPENALRLRDTVLWQMLENAFISREQYEQALEEQLEDVLVPEGERGGAEQRGPNRFKAPYFVEEVRRYLLRNLGMGAEEVFEQGLEVYTTVNMRMQRAAEETLLKALDEFDEEKKEFLAARGREDEFRPVSGGLITIDNRPGHEGKIRAMVGGRDWTHEKYNTVTQAQRLAGSAVKPFVWAAALDAAEDGQGRTPASIVVDEPFARRDAIGRVWAPRNFTGRFEGPVTLRTALEDSINIVSVKLTEQMGMPVVRSYMQRAGITTPIPDTVGLTIALGTAPVTVHDMAVAYSTFANYGVRHQPTKVTEIKDRDGFTRYTNDAESERVFREDLAYLMTYLMEGATTYGTGARTAELDRPRAGKTGTTNNSVDVWFCGYTPEYTTVVWLGYRQGNVPLGMNATGGRVAAPIWRDYMIRVLDGQPVQDFPVPDGVDFHNITKSTGVRGGSFREAFIRGTRPREERYVPPPESDEESGMLEPRLADGF